MENITTAQLYETQTGGANSITGFDYQCLYSCYTVLNYLNEESDKIHFEGLEDIDLYRTNNNLNIQVKHSINKKNSSFFKSIIECFIKIYLSEPFNQNRKFKLIYDFNITEGHIKEVIKSTINKKEIKKPTKKYWDNFIKGIKENNSNWNWLIFNSDEFIKKIEFEYISQDDLFCSINQKLIETYNIFEGNEILYARSLYYYCFIKMKNRETLTKSELNIYIDQIKQEINKGTKNPAYLWIKKISFNNISASQDSSFFEGKNTLPNDIVANYPIPREQIEKSIINSLNNNIITIIKASSGQGKSTLAWRVAYLLHENFEVYKLNYCNETKELDNIIEFILSKIKLGEVPLLIFDNLNENLKDWNLLSQLLYERIGTNYKILITSREESWYNYCGDISQIRKYNFISLNLDQSQAREIFSAFKKQEKIHKNISNWKSAWEQIENTGLLIEYVYLITHGEMLSERINFQIKMLNSQENNIIRVDILKKISLADTLDIPIHAEKLFSFYYENNNFDITNILDNFNKEYFLISDNNSKYITGLHPIRSKHILDKVHKYSSLNNTIIDLLDIVEKKYIPILYSNIPLHIKEENKDNFYRRLTNNSKNKSLNYYYDAIRGLLSGSIQKYYLQNNEIFNQINNRFELLLFLAGINPFNDFPEFNYKYSPIEDYMRIFKDNKLFNNISYQYDKIPKFNIKDSDVYSYIKQFYNNIYNCLIIEKDYEAFSKLLFLLTHLYKNKQLINDKQFNQIWLNKDNIETETLSKIFYCFYIINKPSYLNFIKNNKESIFNYITIITNSLKLYEKEKNNIIIEYALSPLDISKANSKSVERIDTIFNFLPFYENYGAESIKLIPNLFNNHDDSKKRMPIKNVIINKPRELTQIWNNTISKNYEYITIIDWLNFWIDIRKNIIKLNEISIKYFMNLIINPTIPTKELNNYDFYYDKSINQIGKLSIYPNQNTPFHSTSNNFAESFLNNSYFSYITFFYQKIVAFSKLEKKSSHLAIKNLLDANMSLQEMQITFNKVLLMTNYSFSNLKQIEQEEKTNTLNFLSTCLYYKDKPKHINPTKNNIMNWHNLKKIAILNKSEQILKNNEFFNTNWIFPNDIIYEKNSYKLPIIIDDFNLTNETLLYNLINSLFLVSNLEIDFIIILLKEKNNKLKEQGLLINNKTLKNIYNETFINQNLGNPILPIMIEEIYLSNFKNKYIIDKIITDDTFEKICIQLLYYSKLKELQLNKVIEENAKNKIKKTIKELKNNRTVLSNKENQFIENIINNIIYENKEYNFENYIFDIKYHYETYLNIHN